MTSIVIPAHNEEAVLAHTLSVLVSGLDGGVQIVVVCNGCSDSTAAVGSSFGPAVRVEEIDVASKTAALNAGDAIATSFPRIYLDADVELDARSVNLIADALKEPGALAVEPSVVIDTSSSSWPVRAYYMVSSALHGVRPGDIGCGVYAMSEVGRSRFGEFPDVIADDAYARFHFSSEELIRVTQAQSIVRAPTRTCDLLNIKTRSRLGTVELRTRYPDLWKDRKATAIPLSRKVLGLPVRLWPAVLVYAPLQLLTRWRAARLSRDMQSYTWQRDNSSRDVD